MNLIIVLTRDSGSFQGQLAGQTEEHKGVQLEVNIEILHFE